MAKNLVKVFTGTPAQIKDALENEEYSPSQQILIVGSAIVLVRENNQVTNPEVSE